MFQVFESRLCGVSSRSAVDCVYGTMMVLAGLALFCSDLSW